MPELNINKQITILTTATIVSQEKDNGNLRRVAIMVQNNSTGGETISIAIDKEAVAGEGIVLSPGGTWSDTAEGGYDPTQKLITAVGSAATATLAIQERCI